MQANAPGSHRPHGRIHASAVIELLALRRHLNHRDHGRAAWACDRFRGAGPSDELRRALSQCHESARQRQPVVTIAFAWKVSCGSATPHYSIATVAIVGVRELRAGIAQPGTTGPVDAVRRFAESRAPPRRAGSPRYLSMQRPPRRASAQPSRCRHGIVVLASVKHSSRSRPIAGSFHLAGRALASAFNEKRLRDVTDADASTDAIDSSVSPQRPRQIAVPNHAVIVHVCAQGCTRVGSGEDQPPTTSRSNASSR